MAAFIFIIKSLDNYKLLIYNSIINFK